MHHLLTSLCAALSAACLLTLPAQALAQPTEEATLAPVTVKAQRTPDATSEGSGSYTTEATSTATGLPLSIRDTPQSVSVVTSERMQDQAMDTVEDALRATPGVSLKSMDRGRNGLSARGFLISNYQFDGVPMFTGNIGAETISTAPFDRIEVVRGATGLLNGAGDPSAAINLVRKHCLSDLHASRLRSGDRQPTLQRLISGDCRPDFPRRTICLNDRSLVQGRDHRPEHTTS